MSRIRTSLESRGISKDSAQLILQSWRQSTQKQYNSYFKKWTEYCDRLKISADNPSLGQALDFLTDLYKNGAGYSAVNTARSVLSALLKPFDGIPFGSHRLTERLLTGIAVTRPSVPRYTQTWDVAIVLNHLRSKIPLESLTLKDLTLKLVVLVALVTAQRCQTIHLLDTAHMTRTPSAFSFQITKPLKTTKPGRPLPQIELHKYHEDEICVYRTLERYLEVTAPFRKQSVLFS